MSPTIREKLFKLLDLRAARDAVQRAASEAHTAVVALECELVAEAADQVIIAQAADGTYHAFTIGSDNDPCVGVRKVGSLLAVMQATGEPTFSGVSTASAPARTVTPAEELEARAAKARYDEMPPLPGSTAAELALQQQIVSDQAAAGHKRLQVRDKLAKLSEVLGADQAIAVLANHGKADRIRDVPAEKLLGLEREIDRQLAEKKAA